jgi:hypothetical protein
MAETRPAGMYLHLLALPGLIELLLILIFFSFSIPSFGQQLWSGIIDPSRAVDWTQAGFPGDTLPDTSWAQCFTRACKTVMSAGSSATAAQINEALASAPSKTYVSVGAGTFNLIGPIIISDSANEHSDVALRGQGADSTLFVYSGARAGAGCYGGDVVNLEGDCQYVNGGEGNVCTFAGASTTSAVTPGTYVQGATYLSITNCGKTTPAVGSLSHLKVGSILIVDQLNETNDTGTIWNCDTTVVTGAGGCAGNGGGGGVRANGLCNGSTCDRSQAQGFVVVGISGSTVQVSPGLYMSQWRASQKPQAWFASHSVHNVGVENLSVDTTRATSFISTFNLLACNRCWVAGVRSIDSNRSHIRILYSTHNVIRDNYLYGNHTGGTSSYGYEIAGGWNNLLENNIAEQITDSDPSCTAPCAGNVVDYNFDVNNRYTAGKNYIVPPFFLHASGDVFNLWEGNIGPAFSGDNIHGTHHFETLYRNTLPGWQSQCESGACLAQTIPITLPAGDRYMNIIGNVLGQPEYHDTYQCNADNLCIARHYLSGKDSMIYLTGYVLGTYKATYTFCLQPACTSSGSYDPLTTQYLMRWGNYDVVTNAVRFCGKSSDTGWSSICSTTSEVPTGLASYANPVPSYGDAQAGQSAMPASFYYSSKPSFLGSTAWPVAGPDVTGGNLGTCSGGPYSGMAATSSSQCGKDGTLRMAWAGHANANAAMACYLNTMGGPADGTGNVLSFNAAACYPHGK